MLEEVKKAAFNFDKYLINQAQIKISEGVISDEINFGFIPKCTIFPKQNLFQLYLGTHASDENKVVDIVVNTIAYFTYDEGVDRDILNHFFYKNAPAILFPYIRAYISSLTTLSGIPTILLPTINLAGLSDELEKNMEIIEE